MEQNLRLRESSVFFIVKFLYQSKFSFMFFEMFFPPLFYFLWWDKVLDVESHVYFSLLNYSINLNILSDSLKSSFLPYFSFLSGTKF